MKLLVATVALLIAGSVSYATDNFTGVIACTPDGECQYEVEKI
tara:strand:+ start:147 stop:275 length:129 start_codon:yes stop_codon:yes gene_type:complete